MPDLPVSRLAHGEAFQDGIEPHRSLGTHVYEKTPQIRFCGVVFSALFAFPPILSTVVNG